MTSAPDLRSADGSGWKIAVLYGFGVTAAMAVSEAVPVLSSIAREFHPPSHAAVGAVLSLPSLIVALGALFVGWLVDRFGDKPFIFAGAILAALGDGVSALAPSLNVLFVGRVISGVGYVLVAIAAVTMLVRVTAGPRRRFALALWSSFVPMSFIVPFLAAGLIQASGSWRWAFGGHAILLLLFVAIGVPALRRAQPAPTGVLPSRTAGLKAVLRSPWPYALGISFGADAALQTGIMAVLAPYLAKRYGVSEVLAQNCNVVAMAVNIAGCLLVGVLINRRVPAWLIGAVGTIVTGAGAAAIFAADLGFEGAVAASWVFTFGSGLLVGMWALLPVCAPSPSSAGATSGLVTQITLMGVLAGAPLAFSAMAAPTPGPMLTFIGLSLLINLAGLPVWLRATALHAAPATAPGLRDVPAPTRDGSSTSSRSRIEPLTRPEATR
ncbi:MAG: MFS transporter [Azospirillaceae bacterium]|nr:MFS transporter [Azospirillaceae bacterium]